MYPGYKENEVLLDNKGEVIDFQCSLASSMYVNGVKMPEVWCDEECSFSYELEDNEWIKVVDSFVLLTIRECLFSVSKPFKMKIMGSIPLIYTSVLKKMARLFPRL